MVGKRHSKEVDAWFTCYNGNLASFYPKSKEHASLMFHLGAKIPGTHRRLARASYHSPVDEHTKTKPARSPARVRPARRRRHGRPEPPHGPRRITDEVTPSVVPAAEELEPQTGGGGSSGRGTFDDDGEGRRPDRDGDDARNLLIALGLIAVGATVMSARLLAKAGRQPHSV